MKRATILALSSGLALAGCGGTSSGPMDLSTRHAQIAAIDAVRDLAPFDPRGLQPTGTATYVGGISVFHAPGDALLGALELNVDFGGNSFDGTADDFTNAADETYSGTLDMTEGIIERDGNFVSDYSATALIEGTLSGPAETVSVQGFVVGDFAGDDGGSYKGFLRIGLNGDTFEDGDDFGGIVGARQQ